MESKVKYICYFLAGIIFLVGILIIGIMGNNRKMMEREVKCYDSLNNEIVGQICLEKYFPDTNMLSVISIITAIFTSLFMLIGEISDNKLWSL